MSTAVGRLKKGYTITRAAIDEKGALQPEQYSGTYIHSCLVYSSLLNTILDETINDVDHFLMAQDGGCPLH